MGRPTEIGGQARLAAAMILLIACGGCGSTKMSSTPRTGTEQLLLTSAWDDALHKIDFSPLAGVPVYLDTQYCNAVDQGWVVSSIRQSMLQQGVLLRSKPEQAQWVVEARVGAYGTNDYNWLIGVPQTTMPVAIAGLPTGTIPEIPIAKKNKQQGVAKLALFAYDRASGQVTWTSGTSLATSTAKDVYIGAVGPIQSGSIRSGPEVDGLKLPTLVDPVPSTTGETLKTGKPGDEPYHALSPAVPAAATDAESFAP